MDRRSGIWPRPRRLADGQRAGRCADRPPPSVDRRELSRRRAQEARGAARFCRLISPEPPNRNRSPAESVQPERRCAASIRIRSHKEDGSMRRPLLTLLAATAALLVTAAPTLACGGLIGPNGAVNLLRTTTFAGYHDGVEHYVTAFQFAGGGGKFGSITPLPGIPTEVEKGGDWTLQRLLLETSPAILQFAGAEAASADRSAEELMK